MDQHADYDTTHPYRKRGGIAPHLQRNVCLCNHPSGLQGNKCKDCGKLPTYFIYKCVNCEEVFLHDFVLNFCYKRPLCWKCNQFTNQTCIGHNYCDTYVSEDEIRPPKTILKPAFTDQDMIGVFDFLE